MKKIDNKKLGFMMVEALVAVSILTASILISMSVTARSIATSRFSFNANQASFLLEEGAEVVRIVRDNGWSNISGLSIGTTYYPTFSGNTWVLSTTPNVFGKFTRTVNISNVNRNSTTGDISSSGVNDEKTKLVTITVSWVDGGQVKSKVLSFYIFDIFS